METIKWAETSYLLSSITGPLVDSEENNGINWTWKSLSNVSKSDTTKQDVYFAWQFEWDELKEQGIDGFEATITVSPLRNSQPIPDAAGFPKTFTVQLTRSGQWIDYCIGSEDEVGKLFTSGDAYFSSAFDMKPIKNCDESLVLEKTFAASDKTDAILVVEGKKLHVNKQFLSFHSEFFNTLFNSEFKEKSMNEIPIEDVKYEDFARVLCAVYPNPILPTISTFETLLELADRFMMPQVTCLVELFLIRNENVRINEKIALADKCTMDELLETCLKSIETAADMKKITDTTQFEELSDATKVKLFYKTLPFL